MLAVVICTAGGGVAFVLTRRGGGDDRRPALATPEHALPAAFQRALQTARAQSAASPRDAEPLRTLARLCHANGLHDEALATYDRLARLPGGLNARDRYYRADLRLSQNDLAAAEGELREVLRAEPNYVPARLTLASAAFKSGRTAEAETEFAAILRIEPNHVQATAGLARIDLQRGHDDAAVSRLEQLLAAHPEATSGAALLAQVLERRGETARAAALNQWSQQKPEPIPPDPWLSALWADSHDVQRLGLKFEEFFRTGQIAETIPLLRRIEELDTTSPLPEMLKGWSEAQASRHAAAVQHYRAALAKGLDAERLAPHLVRSLLAAADLSAAAALMSGLHARQPESVPIAAAYAEVAVRMKDERLARTLLSRVLEKEPYLYAPNMSLAQILWTAGERDAAAECLRRVALIFVRDVPSRALLGEYYLEKGDPVSAVGPLEQAAQVLEGDTPARRGVRALLVTAYAGQAGAWVEQKRLRAAAETLQKLAALDPENPTVYLSLGDVLFQDGHPDQARREWGKARRLVPARDAQLQAALDDRLHGRFGPELLR